MLGPEKVQTILKQALAISKAEQTEVIYHGNDSSLTRFANNSIHQNVTEYNGAIRVRVAVGKRVGVAESNDLSADAIRRTVETARTIAYLQPENPDFPGLPPPQPVEPVHAFASSTANFTPEARARAVDSICRIAKSHRAVAAGAFRTDAYELAVANSLGSLAYHSGTIADLHTAVMADSASGFASSASADVHELDAEALARAAVDKAMRSRNPIALPPGEYTVLLEEYAVSDLLDYLGLLSFHALAVQEDRSFMKGRFGEKVMSEKVSLWDDARSTETFSVAFDYEGVPKRRVNFIENGIAREVTYDSATAAKEPDAHSTGHSLPAPNPWGPLPMHTFLAPGDATREQMLREVDHGVLVTRFWYTRVVHPLKVVMTGMTRDGTFLIERGEITLPVKNMRFTTSYLDALNHVRQLGRETKLVRDHWQARSYRAPAVLLDGFNFTGVTQ